MVFEITLQLGEQTRREFAESRRVGREKRIAHFSFAAIGWQHRWLLELTQNLTCFTACIGARSSDNPLAVTMPVLASDGFSMSASMPHHSLRLDPGAVQLNSQVNARELVGSAHANGAARAANSDSQACPESDGGAHLIRPRQAGVVPLSRRSWLAGLGGLGLAGLVSRPAEAGVMIPTSLQQLVQTSEHVLVATPRLGDSAWEEVGGSRRIVTYTRLTVEEPLDGRSPADSELLVRTLGGQVDRLGQVVHGEAELRRDEVCVLFLKDRHDGTYRVTGLAQGHYPLTLEQGGVRRLNTSPHLGEVLAKHENVNSAVALLRGQSLDKARALIGGVRRGQ